MFEVGGRTDSRCSTIIVLSSVWDATHFENAKQKVVLQDTIVAEPLPLPLPDGRIWDMRRRQAPSCIASPASCVTAPAAQPQADAQRAAEVNEYEALKVGHTAQVDRSQLERRRLNQGCISLDFTAFQRLKSKYDEPLSKMVLSVGSCSLKLSPCTQAQAEMVGMQLVVNGTYGGAWGAAA